MFDGGQVRIDQNNNAMVQRLVGFLEYRKALGNLDRLVSMLTKEELDELSRAVSEKDEFTVFSNLAGTLRQGPTSFEFVDKQNFERRGLDWVIALARVELGAMLAAFTDVVTPFEVVNPTAYDSAAYFEMLDDATRTHYWALINDPGLREVLDGAVTQPDVLAYTRRLMMARQMLRTAVRAGIDTYTPLQLRELASWQEGLEKVHRRFVSKIRDFIAAQEAVSATKLGTTTTTTPYINACALQLAAFQREQKAGKARIEFVPPPTPTVDVRIEATSR